MVVAGLAMWLARPNRARRTRKFRTAPPTAVHHHLTFDQLQSPTAQLTTHRLRHQASATGALEFKARWPPWTAAKIPTCGPTVARYSLFATDIALQNAFDASVKGDDQISLCPGAGAAPDTWFHNATPNEVAGSIACGTYRNNAVLAWTNKATLVLANVQGGPQGPTVDQLFNWWGSHG